LKSIIEEGSYCNDKLAAEYFGGVLASSRTENGRDDRGARISKIIDSLSVYQLRTHYLIYSNIRFQFKGKSISMTGAGRVLMQIFIPFSSYAPAMDFDASERSKADSIIPHCMFGLASEGLIDPTFYQYGDQTHLSNFFPTVPESGFICQPTALGTELFLWAFGQADHALDFIFSDDFTPGIEGVPLFLTSVLPLHKPTPPNPPLNSDPVADGYSH
jgi:hypothetical protein